MESEVWRLVTLPVFTFKEFQDSRILVIVQLDLRFNLKDDVVFHHEDTEIVRSVGCRLRFGRPPCVLAVDGNSDDVYNQRCWHNDKRFADEILTWNAQSAEENCIVLNP